MALTWGANKVCRHSSTKSAPTGYTLAQDAECDGVSEPASLSRLFCESRGSIASACKVYKYAAAVFAALVLTSYHRQVGSWWTGGDVGGHHKHVASSAAPKHRPARQHVCPSPCLLVLGHDNQIHGGRQRASASGGVDIASGNMVTYICDNRCASLAETRQSRRSAMIFPRLWLGSSAYSK